MAKETLYDDAFFTGLSEGSARSASIVVPMVMQMLEPRSVLDVGCGTGAWVAAWMSAGVDQAVGVDGPYVAETQLAFPASQYFAHDLTAPLELSRRFDLVSCLEVAEHLPAASAETLVASLVRHSDVILFSAAIPGQGGTGHINEQWPSYWVELFDSHGYKVHDHLRGKIWNESAVELWYRQNLLLFSAPEFRFPNGDELCRNPLDIVHPDQYMPTVARPIRTGLRNALLRSSLGPSAKRMVSRFRPE